MIRRIAIWAGAGALVVVFWALYIAAMIGNPTFGNPMGAHGVGWAIICLTCPIALASHHAQSFYLVLVVNAATYGLVGAGVEAVWRHSHIRSISN